MTDIIHFEPNYEELIFEPETTWEDVKRVARKKGFFCYEKELNYACCTVQIYKNGSIYADGQLIVENRSFKQIIAILENMFDDEVSDVSHK